MNERIATIQRNTSETEIELMLTVAGQGQTDIETGVGFLDHLLNHLAMHGLFDLVVKASGDLYIDSHHTVEDISIALGQAFNEALSNRAGINRMGSAFVPMDEALAFVAVDLSGRAYSVIRADWHTPAIGQMPTSLIPHFLETFAVNGRMNLHARVEYGRDDHHQAEALFKALGRALRIAASPDPRRIGVPSTKGTLSE